MGPLRPSAKVLESQASKTVPAVAAFLAVALISTFVVWDAFRWGGADASLVFTDLASAMGPLVAAAACTWACLRGPAASRRAWGLLAGASLSWAVGEVIWSYNDLVLHAPVLFPSWAD